MLKNANVKGNHIAWGRLGIEDYNSLGYVPVDHYRESVARTMEFAYDDWCLARFFEAKGDTEKAREYDLRSQRFKNVLDAETKLCAPVAVTAHGQRLRITISASGAGSTKREP